MSDLLSIESLQDVYTPTLLTDLVSYTLLGPVAQLSSSRIPQRCTRAHTLTQVILKHAENCWKHSTLSKHGQRAMTFAPGLHLTSPHHEMATKQTRISFRSLCPVQRGGRWRSSTLARSTITLILHTTCWQVAFCIQDKPCSACYRCQVQVDSALPRCPMMYCEFDIQ